MSASSSAENAALAKKIVGILKRRFGEIPWWPGDTDEVMIGAILTQQTRWENVEQALRLLKERNLCSLSALCAADLPDIESAIRCTGFYRIKARRLKVLAAFVTDTCGGVSVMDTIPTEELREGLLGVNGIGEETADSILCYGFARPALSLILIPNALRGAAASPHTAQGSNHSLRVFLQRIPTFTTRPMPISLNTLKSGVRKRGAKDAGLWL